MHGKKAFSWWNDILKACGEVRNTPNEWFPQGMARIKWLKTEHFFLS
jgi:hypothetical protein